MSTRFCDLLDAMLPDARTRGFLIITHHGRDDGADGPAVRGDHAWNRGVSQLVSVDLKRAAAMVA